MNLDGEKVNSLFSLTSNGNLAFPSMMNVGHKPIALTTVIPIDSKRSPYCETFADIISFMLISTANYVGR